MPQAHSTEKSLKEQPTSLAASQINGYGTSGIAIKIALFLGLFFLLQTAYEFTTGTWFERFVIEDITVNSAAHLINWITPAVGVFAQGTHLRAAGGGINIINGCDGLEAMLLLIAAMIIAPISLRAKAKGLLIGILFVFILNQIRIVGLFYAARTNTSLFNSLHGTVAPILLIALTVLFFAYWVSRHNQPSVEIR